MAFEDDLVKICPLCGHRNSYWGLHCAGCRESLQQVEARRSPVSAVSPTTAPKGEGERRTKRAEPTEASAPSARLECRDESSFAFVVSDGDALGCDAARASIDLSPLPRSQFISGRHATFHWRSPRWTIEDEGSMNGTCLNGERLAPHQPRTVEDGDVITLANTSFKFRSQP